MSLAETAESSAVRAVLGLARLADMRAHVEPLPSGWRVIAIVHADLPPVIVDTDDTSLDGLSRALSETWDRVRRMRRMPS